MHEKGILHGDSQTENNAPLSPSDQTNSMVVMDFGSTLKVNDQEE
jgi:tRNA A-37 threonylcarbamoyl transferase component Bud32